MAPMETKVKTCWRLGELVAFVEVKVGGGELDGGARDHFDGLRSTGATAVGGEPRKQSVVLGGSLVVGRVAFEDGI